MNEILDQSQTNMSKAASDILSMIRTRKIEVEQFGNHAEQTEQITTMLMKELVERHWRKSQEYYDRYDDEYPYSWFGLRQISADLLDDDTRTYKYTFQMDDDLCEVLQMPKHATFYVIGVYFKMIKLHIAGINCSLRELAKIRRLLETVIPILVMRNE